MFVLLVRESIRRLEAPAVRSSDLLAIIGLMVAVSLLLAFSRGQEFTVAERAGYLAVSKIRVDLHRHLTSMSPRAVQRSSQGALLLRFTGDLSTLRTWLSRGLARGIVAGITLAGGLGVLFWLDIRIGVAVLGVLFLGASVSLVAGDRVRRSTRAVRWRRSLLASHIAEQVRALAVVQVFGRTAGERDRLASQNDDLVQALGRMASTRGRLRLVSSFAGSFAVCTVLIVGAYAVPRGQISVGDIVAAMTAVRFLSGPIRVLGRVNEYWHAGQVSKRKLNDFFNRPIRDAGAPGLDRLRPRAGRLELRNVSVAGALRDVSLTVAGGEMLAITGPNGAGKSTLLSLIARFVEPDSGEIVVDGQVLAECTPKSTYKHLGIVSPDLPLMRGTVRRNLSYRNRDATDAELDRVVLNCRIDELVEELPGGLSAWLTEGATNISVGQRQRIALGRAILGNPRLLLLDEPTTNLDPATSEIFRRVLARYRGTVLLVTHDPAEAALADHVCVMANGRVEDYMSSEEYRARARAIRRVEAGRLHW
jgi:ABC-type multidrug transport system fused ATPase/permease subunit